VRDAFGVGVASELVLQHGGQLRHLERVESEIAVELRVDGDVFA
jgi:hypothetical protein